MPFDENLNHGGPHDPEHNRDGLAMVAAACVDMLEINTKANGLCLRCTRNMVVGRLIIAEMDSIPPARRKETAEMYRRLVGDLLARILEAP